MARLVLTTDWHLALAGLGQTWVLCCRQEEEEGAHWLQAPNLQGGSHPLVPAEGRRLLLLKNFYLCA